MSLGACGAPGIAVAVTWGPPGNQLCSNSAASLCATPAAAPGAAEVSGGTATPGGRGRGGAGGPAGDAGPIKCSLPPRRRSPVGRVPGGLGPSGVLIAAGVSRSQSPPGSRLQRRVSASVYPLPRFTP